jgi:hypothetical protein
MFIEMCDSSRVAVSEQATEARTPPQRKLIEGIGLGDGDSNITCLGTSTGTYSYARNTHRTMGPMVCGVERTVASVDGVATDLCHSGTRPVDSQESRAIGHSTCVAKVCS